MGFKQRQNNNIIVTSDPSSQQVGSSANLTTIEPTVAFLNVDLELEGPHDLTPLVEALAVMFVLHQTHEPPYVANLELAIDVGMDMEDVMSGLLDAIEELDADGQARWQQCTTRRFNIGIQSGLKPSCVAYVLSTQLLERLVAAGGHLVFTLYGAQYESMGGNSG